METLITRIRQREDSAENWQENNPVLASGEIGWEVDTNKFKRGDGFTNWNDLQYGVSETQADLAESDASKPEFILNKSTRYLVNEGEDGEDKYATESQIVLTGVKVNNESLPVGEDKEVNIDLTPFSKVSQTANNISLDMDNDYRITARLFDIFHNQISTSQVDLPLEHLQMIFADEAPTEVTIGHKGQFLTTKINDVRKLYLCTDVQIDAGITSYIWEEI